MKSSQVPVHSEAWQHRQHDITSARFYIVLNNIVSIDLLLFIVVYMLLLLFIVVTCHLQY